MRNLNRLILAFCYFVMMIASSSCQEKDSSALSQTETRDMELRSLLTEELRQIESDNWGLKTTKTLLGWQMLEEKGIRPGEGVTIAHADTGISLHPELLSHSGYESPLRLDLAKDFVDNDDIPDHNFEAINLLPRHGHGTETASVIVSPPGCPPQSVNQGPCVTGAAPAAQLVPIRVSDSVILSFGERLAKGIDHAVAIEADVIVIAMGGVGRMPKLHSALKRAQKAGIITIVAASNFTGPLRIVPAFWDETIAIGAINERLRPWVGSAFGRWIDISAPGVNIKHARTELEAGEIVYSVKNAQGTSDAASLVAGAAALWLSYHGKENLLSRYGREQLPSIFRKILKEHGVSKPKRFPKRRYGTGILDVVSLLEAPLP
ncbi:MAG: S8 family serine peptidase [Pseudobacteriovorax sp.]|nr:S8 family serine peptidase [Pseudobacteriovorax sp.]